MTSRVCAVVAAALLMLGAGSAATESAAARFRSQADVDRSARRPSSSEKRFMALVETRSTAIETAFGALFAGLEGDIKIKFVSRNDPDYAEGAAATYDPERHLLIFRRTLVPLARDEMKRWAASYWPYYQYEDVREAFPVIEVIDDALWRAHLQDAAHRRGLKWPPEDCASLDISQRLGCEMVAAGINEHLRSTRRPIFNANRLDQLWPEDLSQFDKRAWRHDGREYADVRRLGGILLVEPLIRQFGVPRVLSYVAQTPFRIEDNNVRLSALRYQERARNALDL